MIRQNINYHTYSNFQEHLSPDNQKSTTIKNETDFSVKNETPQKEQDVAINSPDPSNISENQLYNLVGRSLTKNFVKHQALQTTSPTQNHHEVENVPSYSEQKQPDFSVHTAFHLRQPLMVDENQCMLGNVETIIGNGSSSPVLNEEEGDHLTTNQLSVILNRLQVINF